MIRLLLRDIRERPSRWVLGLLLFFMFFPQADLGLSALFYIPGTGFTWDADGFMEFVRSSVPVIIIVSFVLCVVLWVAGIWHDRWFWGLTTPRAVYLMLTLLIGPGLIVEAILKPNWGRARPKDLEIFGGDAVFTPPGWVAEECARNCSFVSGHAALAFWVTAYAWLLPRKWRLAGILVGTAFGLAMGFVRVAQGAHFLSDVIFAGVIVLWVN
ncbi:MAG: phosphatase PAP2 family protein, partial [Rhodospirillaceae bacterium]